MGLYSRVRQADEVVDAENPEWSAKQGSNELEAFVAFNEPSTLVLPGLSAPFDCGSTGREALWTQSEPVP
jgi:hypothetical protein